jgi:hypothetical protein
MLLGKPLVAVGIAVGVGAFGTEIAACSSGSLSVAPGPDSQAPLIPPCKAGGLTIAFNPMYSAYDGKHTFQIPALVVGSNSQVTWSADTSMVGIQADTERPNEILIQVLKAGQTTIGAQSSDGKCATAPLNITAALESDWEIGKARYNNGTSLHLAAGATGGPGSPLEQGNGGPACTNCHGQTATSSVFTDVSHTPEQTGGFSDSDILGIVLHGTFPPGKTSYFDPSIVPYPAWQNFHRWADIRPDQERGIIVYLRSLTPAPQKGAVNFGAFDAGSGSGGGDAAAGDGAGD